MACAGKYRSNRRSVSRPSHRVARPPGIASHHWQGAARAIHDPAPEARQALPVAVLRLGALLPAEQGRLRDTDRVGDQLRRKAALAEIADDLKPVDPAGCKKCARERVNPHAGSKLTVPHTTLPRRRDVGRKLSCSILAAAAPDHGVVRLPLGEYRRACSPASSMASVRTSGRIPHPVMDHRDPPQAIPPHQERPSIVADAIGQVLGVDLGKSSIAILGALNQQLKSALRPRTLCPTERVEVAADGSGDHHPRPTCSSANPFNRRSISCTVSRPTSRLCVWPGAGSAGTRSGISGHSPSAS